MSAGLTESVICLGIFVVLAVVGIIGIILIVKLATRNTRQSGQSIPCDNCGARISYVSNFCPDCGEHIYDRMDPHVRERVEEKMYKSPVVLILILVIGGVLLLLVFFAAFVFFMARSNVSIPMPPAAMATQARAVNTMPAHLIPVVELQWSINQYKIQHGSLPDNISEMTDLELLDLESLQKETSFRIIYNRTDTGFECYLNPTISIQNTSKIDPIELHRYSSYYFDETEVVRKKVNPKGIKYKTGGKDWEPVE